MLIEELDEEFLTAVANTALIAERPSGSTKQGFYPGERPSDRVPFEVVPAKCPSYIERQNGRVPTSDEKRGAWHLQQEYAANRLGKNTEENGRLWNDAKWIEMHYRRATLEAGATKPHNLVTGEWGDYVEAAELFGDQEKGMLPSFGITSIAEHGTLLLMERVAEFDALSEIDVNKLVANAGPRTIRAEFPSPEVRVESGKVIRMLMTGMRSLWWPVKRAIADNATMRELGSAEGAGTETAPAVGRQRVIEGLRLAGSIRNGIARRERALEGRTLRRLQTALVVPNCVPSTEWLIREVLAVLPDKAVAANDNSLSPARAA